MKKYNHIIIDGNNLFWRCFSKSLKNYIEFSDFMLFPETIVESLNRVKQIEKSFAYNSSILYFCFDNPTSVINLRKFLNENYKSHRFKKNAPKGLYKTLNLFVEILKCYSDNYRVLNAEALEADDLTFPLIESIEDKLNKNSRCLVISNDLDWARNLSLSDHCFWWNYKKMYNRTSFNSEFGFHPIGKKIQLFKAIHGDSSDNIKNAVPYLPKNILLEIVNTFDNVDDFFKGLWQQDYPLKWKKRIKDAEREIRSNNDLVDFIFIEKDISEYMWVCKKNVKKLKLFYDALDLKHEQFMYSNEDKKSNMFKARKCTK